MNTKRGTYEPGSRASAIANARVRAREEDRPIFVLQYLDGERTYTASMHDRLSRQRVRLHGVVEKHGRETIWIPNIIVDLDDALAFLRSTGPEGNATADEIEKRRGEDA